MHRHSDDDMSVRDRATAGARAEVTRLAEEFYPSLAAVGRFQAVTANDLPPAARLLLAHNNHMTVTVESYHHSLVDVRVLDRRRTARHYARKILLARQSDGGVVQFGLMRIDLTQVDEPVRREIESEAVPLGRILIEHGLLRDVELIALWRIEPSTELARLLHLPRGQTVYGRTALIHVDGEPAVELLEIVRL